VEWWEWTKRHKLLIRQCKGVRAQMVPALPSLRQMHLDGLDLVRTSGKGVIHSYVVVTQPILSAFVTAFPYVAGLVELDDCREPDGTMMHVAGVMVDNEAGVAIRVPAELVFEPTCDPNFVVPRWKVSQRERCKVDGLWQGN
jgi:uncharacterized protein